MPFPKLDIELDDAYQAFLSERRLAIRERAAEAAARAGRGASDVAMLAVSKSVEPEATLLAWRAGWRAFAENRPHELARNLEFAEGTPEMAGVRFDAIGNLQKNKINQVIGRVELLHSVSSLELAEAVSKRCCARGIVQPALVEVNVLGEQSKSGFSPQEAREAAEALAALPGIRLEGLMAMAPRDDADAARRTFSGARELAGELRGRTGLALDVLSCGMSDDFTIAIEEGSTLVRLGRVAFDPAYELS